MQRRAFISIFGASALGAVLMQLPACMAEPAQLDPLTRSKKKPGAPGTEDGDDELPGDESVDAAADARVNKNGPDAAPGTEDSGPGTNPGQDAGGNMPGPADAQPDVSTKTVTLYGTNAVALYFDGSQGPYTGVIRVSYIVANAAITLDFWHGHGGAQHRFTLLPEHFAALKRLEKATLETSVVDGHSHKLYIDPNSTVHRVAGAQPVQVPA